MVNFLTDGKLNFKSSSSFPPFSVHRNISGMVQTNSRLITRIHWPQCPSRSEKVNVSRYLGRFSSLRSIDYSCRWLLYGDDPRAGNWISGTKQATKMINIPVHRDAIVLLTTRLSVRRANSFSSRFRCRCAMISATSRSCQLRLSSMPNKRWRFDYRKPFSALLPLIESLWFVLIGTTWLKEWKDDDWHRVVLFDYENRFY